MNRVAQYLRFPQWFTMQRLKTLSGNILFIHERAREFVAKEVITDIQTFLRPFSHKTVFKTTLLN